jgi:hypothetical protein
MLSRPAVVNDGMVNKIALLLFAGIVVTAMGTGAIIGLEVSGRGLLGGSGGADATDTTPTATPTPDGGERRAPEATAGSTATVTARSTPTATRTPVPEATPQRSPTATPTPGTPTVAAGSFDERRIERPIVELINERRADSGLQGLRHRDDLRRMAGNHSRRMAA